MSDELTPITPPTTTPPPAVVAATNTPTSATPVPAVIAGTSKTKSILIVEDERPLSHALEMKLKSQGFVTKVVTNGTEALAELKKTPYDMMLLDLIMPVMDGFSVLTEIAEQKLKVPVIVLSNLGQDEDRAKAKSLGAVDYFVKSNTPIAEILTRVQESISS